MCHLKKGLELPFLQYMYVFIYTERKAKHSKKKTNNWILFYVLLLLVEAIKFND